MTTDIAYRFGDEAVDLDQLHALLQETYWAKVRPRAQIARALRGSFCASASHGSTLVGFARLVTDFAVCAYLADVIVAPDWRGQGIATRLVRKLVDHESVRTCHITLHTRDAHPVYHRLGFKDFPSMLRGRRQSWSEDRP